MSILLLSVVLAADARPTSADVATAVQISRSQFTEKHSPVSPDRIRETAARREMATVLRSLTNTQSIGDEVARSAAFRQASLEMERLRHEIADAVTKQQSLPIGNELDAVNISRLAVGNVGELKCGRDLKELSAKCVQVLGPDTSVIRITKYSQFVTRDAGARPGTTVIQHRSPKAYATVVLKGYPTSGMQGGQEFSDLTLNLVTVGREIVGGRTLPVLEVFDPEQPFK